MKKSKSDFLRYWGVKILAWTIRLWLIACVIIGLLATANGQRIAGLNLLALSSCCLVLAHTNLD